jgi:NADPH:quinone reductase-like Zn-dependent oxidoreductase
MGADPGQGVRAQPLRAPHPARSRPGVTFPRVPDIEASGIVTAAPRGEFEEGQQVVVMMGGMGRTFDGAYAEYTCAPAMQGDSVPLLPWLGNHRRRPGKCCRPTTGR